MDSGCTDECFTPEGNLIGIKRKTLDEMYELYCQHAHHVGFSVRKSTNRYSAEDPHIVDKKKYVCSSEGRKVKKEEVFNVDGKKRKNMRVTRTGCKAHIKIKLNDDQVYEVVVHNTTHNHPLMGPQLSQFHKSARLITQPTKDAIEVMSSSGMEASQSFCYMVADAGGVENVGHTMEDHMNLMLEIEGGDAQNLIEKLDERRAEEEQFFYRVKLDENRRLSHIFWRDSMMREDYEVFGDVVVFDTTYRTNKYNLICAPFVGINNHWKNIMYGCAFISDEKMESFEWLFNTFKKSMGGKTPITIFTDQDLVISTAIEKVFPETRHRLCIWHLHQNAISRFAELKSDQCFKDIFKKCLTECVDEEEFEACWSGMISKYNLNDNSWFNRLYSLRHKWCTALGKDFFSAGILSSQRSETESTNSTIDFKAKKTTNLTEFYGLFNETVKVWRKKEQEDEFQCTTVIPESTLGMKGILKHASEIYTLINFKVFEDEFKDAISHSSRVLHTEDTLTLYEVTPDDGAHRYTVASDSFQTRISCSCKKYDECGILCSHILRILHINSVKSIPSSYVNKRWTKEAKVQIWNKFHSGVDEDSRLKDYIPWRHKVQRIMYNILLKSQDTVEGRRMVEESCQKLDLDLNALVDSSNTPGNWKPTS